MQANPAIGRGGTTHGDLQGAMSLAQSLWAAGDRSAAARQYELIGNLLASQGQATLALSTFRMVSSLAPHCRDTQLRCADHYRDVGANTEAVSIWEWASHSLASEGRLSEAAAVLSRAVAASPADPDRRRRLAELYIHIGEMSASIEHLHAAAMELLRRRRDRAFHETAARLLAIDPEHVPTLRAVALAHLRRRNLRATFEALRALLAASRGDAVAGELMVELLVVAGRAGAARLAAELVAKVLISMNDDPALSVARRVVARSRRRYPQAQAFVELEAELSTEELDDAAIEVIEESLSVRAPSREAAWEKTGVFNLVAHALRDRTPDDDDGPTDMFRAPRLRAVEETRPDLPGRVVVGRFSATG